MTAKTKEIKHCRPGNNGSEKLEEAVVIETPVEIIKEEMDRNAERVKHELQKIETRKETPSDEKLKEQGRALQLLPDRSKKNNTEERRKKLAEVERPKRVSKNRMRTTTPRILSRPRFSLGTRRRKDSTVGVFQTSGITSHESSRQDLAKVAEDEWQEESSVPRKMHKVVAQLEKKPPTEINEVEMSAIKDYKNSTAPPFYLPHYVHQWFTNTFTYAGKSNPSYVLDNQDFYPAPSPFRMNENFSKNSNSSAPFDKVQTGNKDQKSSPSHTSILSTSSCKSPESPHSDTRIPKSACDVSAKSSTPPSYPPNRVMKQNLRHRCDSSTSKDGEEKNSEVQPKKIKHALAKCKGQMSYAEITSKNLSISSNDGRSHHLTDLNCKFLQTNTSTSSVRQSTNSEQDQVHGEGYAQAFLKAQKRKKRKKKSAYPNIDILIPPNRHGLECFSRPKAKRTKELCKSADQKLQQRSTISNQPWSPDEPWRPGGISKTVAGFKINGLMKAHYKKSGSCNPTKYRGVKGKHLDDEDIDSDPFMNPKHHKDKGFNTLFLGKVLHQQEALWSLRETPHQPLDESDHKKPCDSTNCKAHSTPERTDLPTTKASSESTASEAGPKIKMNSGMTGEGMLMTETSVGQCLASNLKENRRQRKLNSYYSQTLQPKRTQTLGPHSRKSLHPVQMGLQYASFIQQERQQKQLHENPSSCSDLQANRSPDMRSSSQQAQELRTSGSSHPSHSSNLFPSATNTKSPYDHYHTVVNESQYESYRQDSNDYENRESKTNGEGYEVRSDQQSFDICQVGSQNSLRKKGNSSRVLSKRISPERFALLNYYGQSVRPQFLGLHRQPPPIHRCIDVEHLIKQWL
ncbi:hypothetical protein R1flu_028491 [Riccia fluitans]|uniref:Uncharacterized protein n=1 Tax=Riccia fluitans TaxID=41844 RepID=A0ABD1XMG9_9MARC